MSKIQIIDVNNGNLNYINSFFKLKKKPIIAAIVAPWCGHCQNLKPIWESLLKEYRNKKGNGVLATISEDYMSKIEGNTQISGFPTIRLFKNNKIIDFVQERNKENLKRFIDKHLKVTKGMKRKSRRKRKRRTRRKSNTKRNSRRKRKSNTKRKSRTRRKSR